MEKINLNLEGSDLNDAQIELLVNILATQSATLSLVVDRLTKTDEEAELLAEEVAKIIERSKKEIKMKLNKKRDKDDDDDDDNYEDDDDDDF